MTIGLEHWREARHAQGLGRLLISPALNAPNDEVTQSLAKAA
jgi:hypothetical protein